MTLQERKRETLLKENDLGFSPSPSHVECWIEALRRPRVEVLFASRSGPGKFFPQG
jgi:hypothetical protein